MAQDTRPIKPIIVELAPGVRVTVAGRMAKVIAHLAKHADYYNDPDTIGNYKLAVKGDQADIIADNTIVA